MQPTWDDAVKAARARVLVMDSADAEHGHSRPEGVELLRVALSAMEAAYVTGSDDCLCDAAAYVERALLEVRVSEATRGD